MNADTGHGDLEASLVLIFPVLLAYEIGVLFAGNVSGADVVTRALYVALDSRQLYLLFNAAVALAFLLWIQRGNRWGTLRLEVALPVLGGHGGSDYSLGHQLVAQIAAVAVAIGWSAAGSALCFAFVKLVLPLRHGRDAEREGLDIADHGERAYNY